MTLWFDVDDLIAHFQHVARPTGIQRLTFEIYREVWKLGGASGQVRFCRHGMTASDYFVVDWPALEAGILAACAAGPSGKPPPPEPLLAGLELTAPVQDDPMQAKVDPPTLEPALPWQDGEAVPAQPSIRGKIHLYFHQRINPTVLAPLSLIYRAQKRSLLALPELFKALRMLLADPKAPPARLGESTIRLSTRRATFSAEDIFVSLGSSWNQLNAAAGRHLQAQYGLRFAVLIHDLIPELYPEWTSRQGLAAYRSWLRDVVPYADAIFAVSKHSAQDLLGCMAAWNKPVPVPVVLPVGHRPPPRVEVQPALSEKPFDRPFILFVSTIEVRKNHALLFRVWRRLSETLPAAQIPYLVFAGKTAWLTADLMAQLENANWLNGLIKLVESPSEPELTALYEACEFTVFPSLYEGWGLPVTESLSFGKTVAASNRSAIPEAGGDFCSYFDPENLADAYAVIRFLIENPDRVRQLEARIAENFRPPGWADTAAALLDHLNAAAQAGNADQEKRRKIRVAA